MNLCIAPQLTAASANSGLTSRAFLRETDRVGEGESEGESEGEGEWYFRDRPELRQCRGNVLCHTTYMHDTTDVSAGNAVCSSAQGVLLHAQLCSLTFHQHRAEFEVGVRELRLNLDGAERHGHIMRTKNGINKDEISSIIF